MKMLEFSYLLIILERKKKLSKNFKDLLKKNQIIVIEDKAHCIKSISQIESDIELYSPHKFFGIDNGVLLNSKVQINLKNFLNTAMNIRKISRINLKTYTNLFIFF